MVMCKSSFLSFRSRVQGTIHCPVCGSFEPTSSDDLIQGVKPLSAQLRSMRNGGLPLGRREIGESCYDEDDSTVVDPSIEPGLDRFERSIAITDRISDRMQAKLKDKLDKAEV